MGVLLDSNYLLGSSTAMPVHADRLAQHHREQLRASARSGIQSRSPGYFTGIVRRTRSAMP